MNDEKNIGKRCTATFALGELLRGFKTEYFNSFSALGSVNEKGSILLSFRGSSSFEGEKRINISVADGGKLLISAAHNDELIAVMPVEDFLRDQDLNGSLQVYQEGVAKASRLDNDGRRAEESGVERVLVEPSTVTASVESPLGGSVVTRSIEGNGSEEEAGEEGSLSSETEPVVPDVVSVPMAVEAAEEKPLPSPYELYSQQKDAVASELVHIMSDPNREIDWTDWTGVFDDISMSEDGKSIKIDVETKGQSDLVMESYVRLRTDLGKLSQERRESYLAEFKDYLEEDKDYFENFVEEELQKQFLVHQKDVLKNVLKEVSANEQKKLKVKDGAVGVDRWIDANFAAGRYVAESVFSEILSENQIDDLLEKTYKGKPVFKNVEDLVRVAKSEAV